MGASFPLSRQVDQAVGRPLVDQDPLDGQLGVDALHQVGPFLQDRFASRLDGLPEIGRLAAHRRWLVPERQDQWRVECTRHLDRVSHSMPRSIGSVVTQDHLTGRRRPPPL